jgi:phosphatidylinositol phospholipase C eta
MLLNRSWFEMNGNCGYVLKPDNIVDPGQAAEAPTVLSITLLSATQLPKKSVNSEKGEIVDPYVTLQIFGAPCDTTREPVQSSVVSNDGFKPVWQETF